MAVIQLASVVGLALKGACKSLQGSILAISAHQSISRYNAAYHWQQNEINHRKRRGGEKEKAAKDSLDGWG
jgi:hypothetical protein